MAITIEKGIPMADFVRQTRYPWKNMDVGDSFFVTCPNDKARAMANNLLGCKLRQKPREFEIRIVEGGVRVWRTA